MRKGENSDETNMRKDRKLSRRKFLDEMMAGGVAAWGIGSAAPVLNHLSARLGQTEATSASAGDASTTAGKRLVLVTAADWRFKGFVEQSVAAAQKFGYEMSVYDLGRLGFGVPFVVDDANFKQNGYYGDAVPGTGDKNPLRWRTRALFKPALVRHALAAKPVKFIVWMDADAILNAPIDEIASDDYDVGVTVRRITETWRFPNAANRAFVHAARFRTGELHAGVLFFAPTPGARVFLEAWASLTDTLGNDQLALNMLVNPQDLRLAGPVGRRSTPFAPQILDVRGACVKTFPFEYNWRHWPREVMPYTRTNEAQAKILHYCGPWGRKEAVRRGVVA